jgi:hypothetical protein
VFPLDTPFGAAGEELGDALVLSGGGVEAVLLGVEVVVATADGDVTGDVVGAFGRGKAPVP